MNIWRLLAAVYFLITFGSGVALAQAVPSTVAPGRASERFSQPLAPLSRPAPQILKLEGTATPKGSEAVTLRIVAVDVQGVSVYSPEELRRITDQLIGRAIPLNSVYEAAAKLTKKYGADGYVFTRVIVPPQDLDPKGAKITLRAIEGYVDRVEWPADIGGRYADLFDAYTAKIIAERPANVKTIERYLLLANDLPGISVHSKFQASAANTGATTLTVESTFKGYAGQVQFDNRGTKGQGPWQYLTSLEERDALGLRERMTITYAGVTQTQELRYFAGSFSSVLNSEGLTWFTTASYSNTDPGIFELRQLGYKGESFNFETGLSYPVLRSRDENLVVSGSFFLDDSRGDTDAFLISRDRIRGLRVKADYDQADEFGGINQLRVTVSQGLSVMGASDADNPYASRNNGRPDFTAIEFYASRLQAIGSGFSVFGALDGFYSFSPLLSAEQCSYGGRFVGRAFDPSELTGDRCFTAIAEARYDIPNLPKDVSAAQFYNFIDFGTVHRIDPASGEDSNSQGASAGLGFRAGWQNHLNIDVNAAKPLQGRDDKDWRFFLALNSRF